MLEELAGKKVIVVSTESHPKYKLIKIHYVGVLQPSPEGEIKLTDWNDRIYQYTGSGCSMGLDTRPTNRSKNVFIPREKVLHVHELDESKLEKDVDVAVEGDEASSTGRRVVDRGYKNYVFHLGFLD